MQLYPVGEEGHISLLLFFLCWFCKDEKLNAELSIPFHPCEALFKLMHIIYEVSGQNDLGRTLFYASVVI